MFVSTTTVAQFFLDVLTHCSACAYFTLLRIVLHFIPPPSPEQQNITARLVTRIRTVVLHPGSLAAGRTWFASPMNRTVNVGHQLGSVTTRYQHVALKSMGAAKHVAISLDGSRVGGQDLVCGVLAALVAGIVCACWAPPQVITTSQSHLHFLFRRKACWGMALGDPRARARKRPRRSPENDFFSFPEIYRKSLKGFICTLRILDTVFL